MFDKAGAEAIKDGVHQMNAYGQINLIKELSSKAPEAVENIEGWINVNYNFIGLDLTSTPWEAIKNFTFEMAVIGLILIPILAGLFQFIMSWYTMRTQPSAGGANMKTMMYMMPLMSVYFAFIMPAALGVYWIAQSLFSLIQEVIMTNTISKKMQAEEDARYEAIQADRKRRQEEARVLQEKRKHQEQQKQTLKEKREAAEAAKAAKAKKAGVSTTEAGRVGERPYARGRAYKEDRYDV
jgi:YidC/Oxa1 family membrane protein insertase